MSSGKRLVVNGRIFVAVMVVAMALSLIQRAGAQTESDLVALTIRLRAPNGDPVEGEAVTLQRLPTEEIVPPVCTTDEEGTCTWYAGRGLYQLLFERPLDDVSALALAEGGLRGFGLTVGEAAITYHFTLHSDHLIYFDAAPEAPVPAPIIPTLDPMHRVTQANTSDLTTATPAVTPAGSPHPEENEAAQPEEAEQPARAARWRLLLLAGTGLMAGSGLHLWARRRQAGRQTNRPTNQEQDHA